MPGRGPQGKQDHNAAVAIVGQDGAFLRDIERWLASSGTFTCAARCTYGQTVLDQIRRCTPAVTIVELDLPGANGERFIRLARAGVPSLKVLAVGHPTDRVIFLALGARVDGFLERGPGLAAADLVAALHEVLRGGFPLSECARRAVGRAWQQCQPKPEATTGLTPSEKRVAAMQCLGWTEEFIAAQLGTSPQTVHAHSKNIHRKLSVSCLSELQRRLLGRDRPHWLG
jgi:DNA-binding NarL/FixJ family response regulator